MQPSETVRQCCEVCLYTTVVAGPAPSCLPCHDQLQDNQPGQDSRPAGSEDQEPHQVRLPSPPLAPLLAVMFQRLPDQGQASLRLQPGGQLGARPRPSVPAREQRSFPIPRGLQTPRLQICEAQPGLRLLRGIITGWVDTR